MKSAGFEILRLRKEGAVLFVEIAAQAMNLLVPELVRDLVSLIQQTGNPPGGEWEHPLLFVSRFWRQGSNDPFEARIATERVPEGQQL